MNRLKASRSLVLNFVLFGWTAAPKTWGNPEEEARLLAPRVNVYAVKHQLLGIGLPAVRPLFDQVASNHPVVAFEAKSTLRWIAYELRGSQVETAAILRIAEERLAKNQPPPVRQFAAELLGLVGRKEAARGLAALLSDPEASLRIAACQSLEKIPGQAATDALLKALGSATPDMKAAMLRSLGRRRDPKALGVLRSAVEGKDAEVRIAAVGALGDLGDPAALPVLEAVLRKSTPAVKEKALSALLGIAKSYNLKPRFHSHPIEGGFVFRIMVKNWDPGEQARQAQALCLNVISATREDETRSAALRALGGLQPYVTSDSVPVVAKLLRQGSRRVQVEAVEALRQIPGEVAAKALVSSLNVESPGVRYAIIEALGERKEALATPALMQRLEDGDEGVRFAAIQALGRIGDARALEEISHAWERGPDRLKAAAWNASLAIADSLLRKGDKTKSLDVFHQLLDRAATDPERTTVVEALGRVASFASLAKLQPFMQVKGPVRETAVKASVCIADQLAAAGRKSEAVTIYTNSLELASGDLAEALIGRLKRLGVAFASPRGFATYWWIVGPFIGEGRAAWTESYFPEKEVDLRKEYAVNGHQLKWRAGSTDGEGVLDLAGLLTPNENAAAYCFTELTVETEQEVYLKAGSDDGIMIWLNGVLIHDKRVDRALTFDEDRVEARLRSGANRILLKITNGGGDWKFCLRITDRRNRPIKFKIKTEA